MAQRIKITGYVNVSDLDITDLDLEHSTGLSPEGFDALMEGRLINISDLEDVDTEVVN